MDAFECYNIQTCLSHLEDKLWYKAGTKYICTYKLYRNLSSSDLSQTIVDCLFSSGLPKTVMSAAFDDMMIIILTFSDEYSLAQEIARSGFVQIFTSFLTTGLRLGSMLLQVNINLHKTAYYKKSASLFSKGRIKTSKIQGGG